MRQCDIPRFLLSPKLTPGLQHLFFFLSPAPARIQMSQTHVAVGPDEDLYAKTPYQDAAEIGEGSGYVDVAPNPTPN